MGLGGQRHAPAVLPPEMTRYPMYTRLGGPKGRSERVRKISPSSAFDPRAASARSETLYRLSYSDPRSIEVHVKYLRYFKILLIYSTIFRVNSKNVLRSPGWETAV